MDINLKHEQEKILAGKHITKKEALHLVDRVFFNQNVPQEEAELFNPTTNSHNTLLDEFCQCADEIRKAFCGKSFDICAVINGKSGKCTENCKFCAQSSFHSTTIPHYPLMSKEDILKHLHSAQNAGIKRCGIVNAGKRATQQELICIAEAYKEFAQSQKQSSALQENKQTRSSSDTPFNAMGLCASLGLLDKNDFRMLQENGLSAVHNNVETSRSYFSNVCTSHTYDEKITSIQAAQSCNLMVCSGGIFGLGESMKDRVDMAFTLKKLGIKSIPINILLPIKGTPLENNTPLSYEEIRAITAIYRFILPDSYLRIAGGRTLLHDKGKILFQGGANAMISGNMLTITGLSVEEDIEMIGELGFDLAESLRGRASQIAMTYTYTFC